METILVNFQSVSLVLVPVVVALTQIVKVWIIDARWAPLVSIAFGILVSFVAPQVSPVLTVFQGVLFGLMASGLFSGVKTLTSDK